MLEMQPIEITIPRETVNDETVRIIQWHAESGVAVAKDQLICEVETSKAIMEIHAPGAGILTFSAQVGSEVPVGALICTINPLNSQPEVLKPVPTPTNGNGEVAVTQIRATPLARKLASEHGVELSSFPAGSLVRSNDILQKAGKLPPKSQPSPRTEAAPRPLNNPPATGVPVQWEDLPRRKSVEARILGSGQSLSIQSSVAVVCHASALNPAGRGALILFETARLLKKYPMLNAIHDRGRMGKYQEVNIGWALDGGQGLLVPVIKNADTKSLQEIAAAMESQVEAYLMATVDPTTLAARPSPSPICQGRASLISNLSSAKANPRFSVSAQSCPPRTPLRRST